MAKQAFEKKVAELEALRSAEPATALLALRKALKDRNNYLVSKAAAIVSDLRLEDLIPDLTAAYDRFFQDPVKSDPQCWAKNAIVKALKDLGYRTADVFLRGIEHVQMEPVWGGTADSAATLRGACALALIDCQLDDRAILTCLGDRLGDKEKRVRVDAALAIGQFGSEDGAPLLRLKALLGDTEPEVTGQCFIGLMALLPSQSLPFIRSFLHHEDEDVCAEAAAALATSRELEALEILKSFWKTKVSVDVRRALLISLGASPLRNSADFLVEVLSEESSGLESHALTALAASRFHTELHDRIKAIVDQKADAELSRIFAKRFSGES